MAILLASAGTTATSSLRPNPLDLLAPTTEQVSGDESRAVAPASPDTREQSAPRWLRQKHTSHCDEIPSTSRFTAPRDRSCATQERISAVKCEGRVGVQGNS